MVALLDKPEYKPAVSQEYVRIVGRQLDRLMPNSDRREWANFLREIERRSVAGERNFICVLDAFAVEYHTQVGRDLRVACVQLLRVLEMGDE